MDFFVFIFFDDDSLFSFVVGDRIGICYLIFIINLSNEMYDYVYIIIVFGF